MARRTKEEALETRVQLLDPAYFPLDQTAEWFVDVYLEGLRNAKQRDASSS